jgi:uncharacterized protein YjbI with pentapeptide repeats
MLGKQDILARLAAPEAAKNAVVYGQNVLGDLDFRDHVFESAAPFMGAIFEGAVDFTGAVFRNFAGFGDCHFMRPARFSRCRFEGVGDFTLAHFHDAADFHAAKFRGVARFWHTRFDGDAEFGNLGVTVPERLPDMDLMADFSWSSIAGKATFTFSRFHVPVWFWRTRFGGTVLMDDCEFHKGVTLAGNPTDVQFPRLGPVDRQVIAGLEKAGLFRPVTDIEIEIGNERMSQFVQFNDVWCLEHLRERLDAAGVVLSPFERTCLESAWTEGATPMFKPGALVSFRNSAFNDLGAVQFNKVDFTGVNLDSDVAGGATAQTAFRKATVSDSYDLFMCHNSQDKTALVRPLVEALARCGQRVWYDESGVAVGQSLQQTIDQGLARARGAIVVLSPAFLAGRKWTKYEVSSLMTAAKKHGRKILPVWLNVSEDEIAKHAPELLDLLAIKAGDHSVNDLALKLIKELHRVVT